MIDIKDTTGQTRFSTEINTGSKRKFSLMSEDYITLKFSVEEPVYFKLGDHVDTELGLFELVDLYKPTLNESTGSYDYDLRLDAYYWKWKNKIFRFNPEVGGSEASWKLTSTLDVHMGVFLRNLTALGYTYKGTPFEVKIDSTVAKTSKLIIYDNVNLIDALTQMAETWECEWWLEDNQICFGRCEFGDPVDFEIGNNVEKMTREESKTTFATRVYAFGSTRNIPTNYRPVDESVVVNGIVQKRLMMPVGVPYVDAYPGMTTEEAVEDVVTFDDIYPRRTGTMSSVTPVEKPEKIENPDGTTTESTYTVYQFKDAGINFSKDYILPSEELRIVFQTGAMAGMDFAVSFNPTGQPEKLENGNWNPEAQLWEIMRNDDYGRTLPADSLIPKNGDTYNLYGFDSTSQLFGDMVSKAEEELEEAARKHVEKTKIDPNTYPCTMMSDYMYNGGNVRTNEFTVGAKINLINPAYFEDGRVSRVIGFEFDLDIPYSSPIFTIGETAGYSRLGDIEDKVDELTYKGQVFTGNGSGVYVIGTNDNTPPTNKNVYSALKILREFVRFQGWVDQPVRTSDPVQFKSVSSTDFESKLKGWIIDALGNAEFRDLLARSFKSWNFAAGPLGAGVGMVNDDEFQTDRLLVRKIMYVLEMMIQRMKFQGGIMVLSPAVGFKINSVEVFETYYRLHCHPEDLNEFEVDDQARIQNFTGKNIKYLWSLVLSRGDDYIDISRVDKDGDGVPEEGDEIVQLGNRTNPDRQDAVLLSAVNGEVGIITYFGINSFDLSDKEGSWLGKHGGKKGAVIKGEVHITAGSDGLDQFTEYEDVNERIQNAQDSADSVQEIVNNLTSIIIPDLQGQIDGSIMSWEGTVAPTLTNEPAVNWTKEEEKNRHLGDYYDYFLTVDGEQVTERYKFSKVNGAYQWVRVADSGSALAASVAREALGLAGTKAAITWGNSLPVVPYNVNDVWIKVDGTMYICNHQRLEGETGSQSDWQLFNDTTLRLSKMADDNIITVEEKATLRDTWAQIQKEFTSYQAQATTHGVSITSLQNAYNALNTFLSNTVNISGDTDTTLSVAQKTEYNQDFANYYSERTAFANLVAQKVADGAVSGIQLGTLNLLKGSNVELNRQQYSLGTYFYDTIPEVGKTYTIVMCYTLGENNTHINVYEDYGNNFAATFNTRGNRVIESKSFKFTIENTIYMGFVQFPNGTYGSKVHWAVLVEGNKGPSSWVPSLSEQGEQAASEAVDNLQIGSVNLVSRKMMLAWNEKNKNIAVWGQDADGIYLAINQKLLYENVSGGTSRLDCFLGEGKYKANTQYVFQVEWKLATAQNDTGISFWAVYTDGTSVGIRLDKAQTSLARANFITAKGKTVIKIYASYEVNTSRSLIYSLALYEGNKVLTELPVATEDLQGQSNVNLLDNSKFQFGTEGYTPNLTASLNVVDGVLQVRSSQTDSSPGVRFPKVHLKPGVYTVKVNTKGVNIPSHSVSVYKGDMSSSVTGTGYIPVLSTFTEKLLTFAISTEGDYRVLMAWQAPTATAYPAGLDIEYSILVEGFTPPSSWSPSAGDVQKNFDEITDRLDEWASDGYISPQEKTALKQQKNDIQAEYNEIVANANRYKISLTSYTTAYNAAISALNKYTATSPENIAVGSDYNNIAAYYPARQTILDSIAAAAKAQADQSTSSIGTGEGKMLFKDPEFRTGNNSVATYNYGTSGTVTVSRVARPSDCPTTSTHCMKITTKSTGATPGLGGFVQSIQSRNGAVFIQKFIAKVPVGYTLNQASNGMGTGSTSEWLTSREGTGKYETYILKITCGTSGTFKNGGYVYLSATTSTPSFPVEWYLAYCTAFDLTSDGYGDIESVTKDDFARQMGYKSFQDMADEAVEKGGKLVVDGLLNAKLIDVDTLAANNAFINKLTTNILKAGSITAGMISVDGFVFADNNIYGGEKFGDGAGVNIVSNDTERAFKAYVDENNVVSMFYNSNDDWGLKGLVDGSPVFQLGSTNKIGPFSIHDDNLFADNPYNSYKGGLELAKNRIRFAYAEGSIYSQMAYLGVKGGSGSSYGTDTILAVVGGDIWNQGVVRQSDGTSRSCRFYSSDIHMRGIMKMYNGATITDYDGNVVIKNGLSGGKIKNLSIYGTSNTIASDYKIGIIGLIASSGCNTTLSPGEFIGQTIYLLNYTTSSCNLMRNDDRSKMAKLGGQKTAKLYYNGTTWLPVYIVNTYEI